MYIGSMGSIPFIVSRPYVLTFDGYNRSSDGRWAKHDIIGDKPRLEFIGPNVEKINFKIQLTIKHNVVPERELERLRKMRDKGKPFVLVIGNKPIGRNMWVLESLSEEAIFYNALGMATSVNATVSLTEYVEGEV